MSVAWLQPVVWWGLLLLSAPIAIHLLSRQRHRRVPFPTLRFLQVTRFAALRRRVLSDLPLLVVRLLLVTAAVAALAAPVLVTPWRDRVWQQRTARAIVEVSAAGADAGPDRAASAVIVDERTTAFVSWTAAVTGRAADVIRSATAWLDQQPPAGRELVIIGDLRAGFISETDVARIPAHIGIRILPLSEATPTRTLAIAVTTATSAGELVRERLRVTLEDAATRVERGETSPILGDPVTVVAASFEEAWADAVREAVLAEGLVLPPDSDRRVVVEFRDAPVAGVVTPPEFVWMRRVLEATPNGRGGERAGALVVRLDMLASDARAASAVAHVARAAFTEPLDDREPRRISPATLAAWSRPPGPIPSGVEPADEGDRRWLWLAVLGLLAVEHVMRRRVAPMHQDAAPADEGARVA